MPFVVAGARDGVRRNGALDLFGVARAETNRERAERVVELRSFARADDGDDVLAAREHPRDGELHRGRVVLRGDVAQCVDELLILRAVLAAKARRPTSISL